MKKSERILTQFGAESENRVRLSTRLLTYLSVWLFAALAVQLFLQPEGLSETDLSPIQQRLLWPLYTPLMVVVGLAYALTWPSSFPGWMPWVIVAGLSIHATATLTRVGRPPFAAMICIQIVLLAVAVIYFIRQSYLPTGG